MSEKIGRERAQGGAIMKSPLLIKSNKSPSASSSERHAHDAIAAVLVIRPKGPIKLCAFAPSGGSLRSKLFTMPQDAEAARKWITPIDGIMNIYFEPNPPRRKSDARSKEVDISHAMFAYVDCDPVGNEAPAAAQARHQAALSSGVVPAPTLQWASGGGTVAMWRLRSPIELNSPKAIAEAKAINVGLAQALGGKSKGYDNCHSVEHLYRVPHTMNVPDARKVAKGREAVRAGGITSNPKHIYKASDLPTAQISQTVNTTVTLTGKAEFVEDIDLLGLKPRIVEIIQNGKIEGETKERDDSRSAWRFEAVCGMIRAGVSAEIILGILINPEYEISARVLAAGGGAEQYARKEIARAQERISAQISKELAEDFGNAFDLEAHNSSAPTKPASRKIIKPTPFIWTDPATIRPREWIYKPYYIRTFAGSTVATGGAGKSSLILVEMIAMATGKNLLGVDPASDLRVWYWNGEDPQDELRRRVQAILLHYNITSSEIDGRLFIDSGRDLPIRIATLEDGRTKIAEPVEKQMIEAILDLKIDCLAIDPFVSSHGVPENDNGAIDMVAKKWADIADKTNSHIHISHHTRKTNGSTASAEDSRGASSLNNAMRSRRALNTMTSAEAGACGIQGNDRLSYFKADTAGSSMTKPVDSHEWYKIVSVPLGNGNGFDVAGDDVGVVTKWNFQIEPLEFDDEDTERAISSLSVGGPWRESPLSPRWAGHAIARVFNLDVQKDKKKITRVLFELVSDGSVERYEDKNGSRQKKFFLRPAQTLNFG